MAVSARNNHSGTADWVGKNLNAVAKAVANEKPLSIETGFLKLEEC